MCYDAAAIRYGCIVTKDVRPMLVAKFPRSSPAVNLNTPLPWKRDAQCCYAKVSERMKMLEIETRATHMVPAKTVVGR